MKNYTLSENEQKELDSIFEDCRYTAVQFLRDEGYKCLEGFSKEIDIMTFEDLERDNFSGLNLPLETSPFKAKDMTSDEEFAPYELACEEYLRKKYYS